MVNGLFGHNRYLGICHSFPKSWTTVLGDWADLVSYDFRTGSCAHCHARGFHGHGSSWPSSSMFINVHHPFEIFEIRILPNKNLVGGDWLPSIWHFPRNIGNFISSQLTHIFQDGLGILAHQKTIQLPCFFLGCRSTGLQILVDDDSLDLRILRRVTVKMSPLQNVT